MWEESLKDGGRNGFRETILAEGGSSRKSHERRSFRLEVNLLYESHTRKVSSWPFDSRRSEQEKGGDQQRTLHC